MSPNNSSLAKKPKFKKYKKPSGENKIPFTWKEFKKQWFLMLCTLIIVVYGIIFYYVPIAGWIMAFQHYKPKTGLLHSKFVFLDKFIFLFTDDTFIKVIRNTLCMGVINLVVTFITAIAFAILLNEIKSTFGKKSVQTISYLPHLL